MLELFVLLFLTYQFISGPDLDQDQDLDPDIDQDSDLDPDLDQDQALDQDLDLDPELDQDLDLYLFLILRFIL